MLDANLYVACIDLRGRRALVVGAGRIGLEKIEGLLACDAEVKVVATVARQEVMELAGEGRIELHEREYSAADLNDCFLVVAATSDTELNTQVFRDAEASNMLVNVVDVPQLCNFILPAIHRIGPIAVAISTAGASPALAKRMKREAATAFGSEYAELAFMLDEIRDWAKRVLPTYDERRDFFEAIVNGEPDPLELLRRGEILAVRELIARARKEVDPEYDSQLLAE
jgi:siroheme synthase-like protein